MAYLRTQNKRQLCLASGTAYIELARAAAKEFYGTGDYSIEIKRVYFIEPLVVSGSDVVDVQIKLTRQVINFK